MIVTIDRSFIEHETILAILLKVEKGTFWLPKKFFKHGSNIDEIIINVPDDFEIKINDVYMSICEVFKDK